MEERKEEVKFLFTAAFCFMLLGILSYWLVFDVIAPFFFAKSGFDKGALATMMGWSATLYIGYAGYVLFDKWKDQENKKIARDETILCSKNMFIFAKKLINFSRLDEECFDKHNFNLMNAEYFNIYSSLNLIAKINKDDDIKKLQSDFKNRFNDWITLLQEYQNKPDEKFIYQESMRLISMQIFYIYNDLVEKINIR